MDEDENKAQTSTKVTIKDGRKPAEIYRTDLITAMKIPDHQVIPPEAYFNLSDPWKQEWERGVQVPVNMESLPQPSFEILSEIYRSPDFKLPNKLLKHETKDEKDENQVLYDLDDEDMEWLKALNRSRKYKGLELVDEFLMEKAMASLEDQCYTNMGETIATEKGLSIEYDEDISCDVCRVPECEDGNEIIFCDVCDVAVHQACYGVKKVPIGSWVCKPCAQLISDSPCLLCPNKGGAMKRSTSKGYKGWVHMSCALWVPEVGIGDVEKMEPITRLETITPGRWNLLCYLCKEKQGACIQCTVKTCVKAFHVTCGFNNNLEMQTVLDESTPDGVRHVCYCYKHGSKRNGKSPRKSSTTTRNSPRKTPTKSSTSTTPTKSSSFTTPTKSSSFTTPTKSSVKDIEEQENIRQKKLRGMEEEFYKFADIKILAAEVQISGDLAKALHSYWTLKRKARDDVSLLPPTAEQQELLAGKQIKPYQRATMEVERVVKLRQDLERIRNLCYMIEKREKQKRDLTKAREVVFRKEMEIVDNTAGKMTSDDMQWARSCCKNNFTEYVDLQNLDLNYRRKSRAYKPRKKRRRVCRPNLKRCSDDEYASCCSTASNGSTNEEFGKKNPGNGELTLTDDVKEQLVDENPLEKSNESTVVPKVSTNDQTSEKSSEQSCCRNDQQTKRRVEDLSSDSDFEDDTRLRVRRRPALRRRSIKASIKNQQKNGIIRCNEPASSSPGQSTDQVNVVHLYSRKHEWLSLDQDKTSSKINYSFSPETVPVKHTKSKSVIPKSTRKANNSSSLPCRTLRSNNRLLERRYSYEQIDCRNRIVLNLKNDGNFMPSSTIKEQETTEDTTHSEEKLYRLDKEGREKQLPGTDNNSGQKLVLNGIKAKQEHYIADWNENESKDFSDQIIYRTRSRSSSSEPGSPNSHTRTSCILSKRFSVDRKSTSCSSSRNTSNDNNGKLGRLANNIKNSCNSTRCSPFFGRFRRTATTSA